MISKTHLMKIISYSEKIESHKKNAQNIFVSERFIFDRSI